MEVRTSRERAETTVPRAPEGHRRGRPHEEGEPPRRRRPELVGVGREHLEPARQDADGYPMRVSGRRTRPMNTVSRSRCSTKQVVPQKRHPQEASKIRRREQKSSGLGARVPCAAGAGASWGGLGQRQSSQGWVVTARPPSSRCWPGWRQDSLSTGYLASTSPAMVRSPRPWCRT